MADLKSLSPKGGKRTTQVVDKKSGGWLNLLVWFLVVSILAYVILYTWNPTYLQKTDVAGKPTGVSDPTTTIIASVVIGLVVAALIHFLKK